MMTFYEAVFWVLFTLVCLTYEILYTINPGETQARRNLARAAKAAKTYEIYIKAFPGMMLLGMLGSIIILIGIFSSQSLIFFVYLMFSLLSTELTNLYEFARQKWYYVLDGLFCIALIFTAVLNKFVFHVKLNPFIWLTS